MTKRIFVASVAMLFFAMLCSCHKTCRCYAYDGTTTDYTSDEVKAQGVTCTQMYYQYGTNYYSLCEWDN